MYVTTRTPRQTGSELLSSEIQGQTQDRPEKNRWETKMASSL